MALGMEVGLGRSHIVLDGDPAPLPKKGTEPPIFGPFWLSLNGWMHQDATWYGGRPRHRRLCLMGTQLPPEQRAHPLPPSLWPAYCGQTAGWMKTPLGTEVDIGPSHIVLDGVPALRETGTAAPIFSARVYCGYGRPSQLLLSSCSQPH